MFAYIFWIVRPFCVFVLYCSITVTFYECQIVSNSNMQRTPKVFVQDVCCQMVICISIFTEYRHSIFTKCTIVYVDCFSGYPNLYLCFFLIISRTVLLKVEILPTSTSVAIVLISFSRNISCWALKCLTCYAYGMLILACRQYAKICIHNYQMNVCVQSLHKIFLC